MTVTSTGNFTVNPSPLVVYGSPLDLCSLQEIKDWLDLSVDTQDRKLSRLITSASTLIRQKIERNLEAASYTETRNGNGGDRMVLRNTPINSIASVVVDRVSVPQSDGVTAGWTNDSTTVYMVDRHLLPIAIYPYLSGGFAFNRGYQNITISYNGGFQVVPLDLKQAALELVTQKFNRSKHSDQRSQSIGGEVISYSEKEMPDEVMLVINRYRQRSMIAP